MARNKSDKITKTQLLDVRITRFKLKESIIRMTESARPKVYLAGPGVFRPDAKAYGDALREKCVRAGLFGCFPLDNEISNSDPRAMAEAIYRANVNLINSTRAIIADISPFRGPNMDPGTAWEIGYGIAKALPVFAWTAERSDLYNRSGGDGADFAVDRNGWTIENFGLAENLMIAVSSISVHFSEDDAIAACAQHFR